MADKFRANLWIVLPAAIATLSLYMFIGNGFNMEITDTPSRWWLMIPYLVVIATAVSGLNVTIVLVCGIISAIIIGLISGTGIIDACRMMGDGIGSMGELIVITLLAAGMLGLIKAMGGITYLLQALTRHVSGIRGAQWCIAAIVSMVNLCTANNTVAIITVGSISRDISHRYGISPQKTASILDTCSCIVQSIIPYGAQTLLATGLAGISPAAPWQYMYYPWLLAGMVSLSIIFRFPRPKAIR